MVKLSALLLTVLSSAVTFASADSAYLASFCKVLSSEDIKRVRVIYQSPATEDVNIQILDKNQQLVHIERVGYTDGFVKIFNMSRIPAGEYTFLVKSDSYSHKQTVLTYKNEGVVEEWEGQGLNIAKTKDDDKYALVGVNDSGASLSFVVEDDEGNAIYWDRIQKGEQVKRLINLEQVEGEDAKLLLFRRNEKIKEVIVSL
ncbi:MAG: hypothetical protein KI790_19035 [Cyclobacteriaceae bacterium]|nr:hypothetical protein [Cyclobacteriaceae bacterium HetDA_MAG_MS6]